MKLSLGVPARQPNTIARIDRIAMTGLGVEAVADLTGQSAPFRIARVPPRSG
jgi:hypothetical protein